jgi:hypothetical protein
VAANPFGFLIELVGRRLCWNSLRSVGRRLRRVRRGLRRVGGETRDTISEDLVADTDPLLDVELLCRVVRVEVRRRARVLLEEELVGGGDQDFVAYLGPYRDPRLVRRVIRIDRVGRGRVAGVIPQIDLGVQRRAVVRGCHRRSVDRSRKTFRRTRAGNSVRQLLWTWGSRSNGCGAPTEDVTVVLKPVKETRRTSRVVGLIAAAAVTIAAAGTVLVLVNGDDDSAQSPGATVPTPTPVLVTKGERFYQIDMYSDAPLTPEQLRLFDQMLASMQLDA